MQTRRPIDIKAVFHRASGRCCTTLSRSSFDEQGHVLLQKRATSKITFPDH